MALSPTCPPRDKSIGAILERMGSRTNELLEAFDALPVEEKRVFTVEFLRRTIPFDSGALDDEETARAGDELFASLDAEDNGARPR